MEKQIRALLELIGEIVDDSSKNWSAKKALIMNAASDSEADALNEFLSWFEE